LRTEVCQRREKQRQMKKQLGARGIEMIMTSFLPEEIESKWQRRAAGYLS